MPPTQHQEGGAVSHVAAELARAKLSTTTTAYCYYTCTHIHTMHSCRDVACDAQVQRMLASHVAGTVKLTRAGYCLGVSCMCLVWEDTSDRDEVDASRKT